ncbi:hypothetical protein VNI00_016091 [Paramarasmius palmivorus]|uniref:Uncharacterized protein n=1 Tax=Paramarasmius palmivorus TaxID=297713 RepID=A0AAW0BHA6_9AGAR
MLSHRQLLDLEAEVGTALAMHISFTHPLPYSIGHVEDRVLLLTTKLAEEGQWHRIEDIIYRLFDGLSLQIMEYLKTFDVRTNWGLWVERLVISFEWFSKAEESIRRLFLSEGEQNIHSFDGVCYNLKTVAYECLSLELEREEPEFVACCQAAVKSWWSSQQGFRGDDNSRYYIGTAFKWFQQFDLYPNLRSEYLDHIQSSLQHKWTQILHVSDASGPQLAIDLQNEVDAELRRHQGILLFEEDLQSLKACVVQGVLRGQYHQHLRSVSPLCVGKLRAAV